MNTQITDEKPKITLPELKLMEKDIDRIYTKSIFLSEQTQNAIFKARHLIRMESDDIALAEALETINRNMNTN